MRYREQFKGKNPVVDVAWHKKAPSVVCKYKLSDVDTVKQVNKFVDKFGINNAIMREFCSKKVDKCPNEGSCSRLRSNTAGAELCRIWYAHQPAAEKDSFMQNYCNTANTYDCKCVNRSLDPIYDAIKPGKVINDGCWFTPCANQSKFYVPSQLLNPTCPDNVCDIIYNFINDHRINIDDVKNEINCTFNPKPAPKPAPKPGPKPGPEPGPKPKPTPTPTPTPSTPSTTTLVIFLIGIVFLTAVIAMANRR